MNSRTRNCVSVSILCVCVLFSQLALAQQAPPAEQKASPPAVQKGSAPVTQKEAPQTAQKGTPEPSIALDLAFLLGKWETKVKIYPNELLGTTEDVKGGGTAEFHTFGKVIEGATKSVSSRGPYEDREFIFYNPGAKAYEIFAINAEGYATSRTLIKKGKHFETLYKGKRAVVGKNGKNTGKEVQFTVRGKYEIISDSEVHYNSEINFGNSGFKRFVRMQMNRTP